MKDRLLPTSAETFTNFYPETLTYPDPTFYLGKIMLEAKELPI